MALLKVVGTVSETKEEGKVKCHITIDESLESLEAHDMDPITTLFTLHPGC